MGNRG
jgi:hypothetical protein